MRHSRNLSPASPLAAMALLLLALPSLSGCALIEVTPKGVNAAAQAAGRQLKAVPLDETVLKKLSNLLRGAAGPRKGSTAG